MAKTNAYIGIRVTDEFKARLERQADKERRSVSKAEPLTGRNSSSPMVSTGMPAADSSGPTASPSSSSAPEARSIYTRVPGGVLGGAAAVLSFYGSSCPGMVSLGLGALRYISSQSRWASINI